MFGDANAGNSCDDVANDVNKKDHSSHKKSSI